AIDRSSLPQLRVAASTESEPSRYALRKTSDAVLRGWAGSHVARLSKLRPGGTVPARGSEVERIQRWRRLLRLLSAEDPACRSRTSLAAALEVAPASLGRDLKDLAKLGAEIEYQRGRGYRLAGVFDPLVEVVTP